MSLLAYSDVLAFLEGEDEIPGALRWAAYYGLEHTWDKKALLLTVRLIGGSDREREREPYLLIGTFEDYRAMPPAWRFLDPRTRQDIGLPAYPAAGPFPLGSVLHSNGVICAPWNRLAYADRGGPHSDWNAANWQTAAPQHSSARTIPDMLARIRAELTISPRRLASLPALTAVSQ